ncbi:MAG: acetyl-CoA carboxylase biotin carboxyl carrier protein subunit [Chthonomonas sp.]|nr:acetyl-CoA carboxylase biotin carboxyl carrier protein subunit [Chthonomonas sp.]
MKVLVNGVEAELLPSDWQVERVGEGLRVRTPEGSFSAVAVTHHGKTLISFRGRTFTVEPFRKQRGAGPGGAASGESLAPMPAVVVDVLVAAGDTVTKGQRLLVIEAMKTQQPINAAFDGVVEVLPVSAGQQLAEGQLLVRVKPHA